jgi:hypothetical protein
MLIAQLREHWAALDTQIADYTREIELAARRRLPTPSEHTWRRAPGSDRTHRCRRQREYVRQRS